MGVAAGVVASALYWTIVIVLSRPRFRFSPAALSELEDAPGSLRVKVLNRMPWSVRGVTFHAALVREGGAYSRIHEPLVVRSFTQPVMGGWWNAIGRRRRYGWMGASHRVIEISRVAPSPRSLADEVKAGAELAVWIECTDGLLLAFRGWVLHVYGASDVQSGIFARGRSLRSHQVMEI